MTITTLTFVIYAVVALVLLLRIAVAFKAGIDLWTDPKITPYRKTLMLGYGFWGKTVRALSDVVFSTGAGFVFMLMIPGLAGGPVGAVAGLTISAMLNASGWYIDKRRQQLHA